MRPSAASNSRQLTASEHGLMELAAGGRNRVWHRSLPCGTIRSVPRKIRQLVADLERAGFVLVPGGKGRIASSGIPSFPDR